MKTMQTAYDSLDAATMKAAAFIDRHNKAIFGALILATMFYASVLMAGTTGAEFEGIYNQVKDWTEGYLGKAIALFAFLLGLGVGVARQSPIPAISGVVFALFVAFGPQIIEGIASAVI